MAAKTKRYLFDASNADSLKKRTDPATVVVPGGIIYADVAWDDAIADEAAVNEALALSGIFPAPPGAPLAVDVLLLRMIGDPLNSQLQWVVVGPTKVLQLFNSDGDTRIVAEGEALLEGDAGARVNSPLGPAQVIGQSVSAVAQNGNVTLDATDDVIVSGDRVIAQAVAGASLVLDADYGTMTKHFVSTPVALADGASVPIDPRGSNQYTLTRGSVLGVATLAFPVPAPLPGSTWQIDVKQAVGGVHVLLYAAGYSGGLAGLPVLSLAAGLTDILTFKAISSSQVSVTAALGF
jgi:hypothetical protein